MRKRKGQSAVEFTILVVIILGAFLAIGNYFKRGIQGRWKAAVDDLGDQYDPRVTDTDITSTMVSNTDSRITTIDDGRRDGFWTLRRDLTNAVESKTGFMRVDAN